MEARIALCKCREGGNIYGVRFEKMGDGWKYTWAFPVKEAAAKREHYDETKIVGQIFPESGYRLSLLQNEGFCGLQLREAELP